MRGSKKNGVGGENGYFRKRAKGAAEMAIPRTATVLHTGALVFYIADRRMNKRSVVRPVPAFD